MSLSNSGSFYVDRGTLLVQQDSSAQVILIYRGVSSGRNNITTRTLFIPPPALSGSITDERGNVISANVPAALATAITTFGSQIETSLSGAVNAGKLDL